MLWKRNPCQSLLWCSVLFKRVQHIVLADVEPHPEEQVIPAGLHEEEAAGAQVSADGHGLWHGGVGQSFHPAQFHMLPINLDTEGSSVSDKESLKGKVALGIRKLDTFLSQVSTEYRCWFQN